MIEVPKWATEATAPIGTCSRISERFSFISPAFSVKRRPVLIAVRRFTLVNWIPKDAVFIISVHSELLRIWEVSRPNPERQIIILSLTG